MADTPSLRLTGANMKLPDKVLDEVDKREVDGAEVEKVDKAEWEEMWDTEPGGERELSEKELDPEVFLREDERSRDV